MSTARCTRCGRFLGEPAQVIRVRDTVHPYTADYEYLCARCAPTEPEHGADWSDWDVDHPEEGPSCKCGYNGTPEECAAYRAPAEPEEKR